MPLHYREIDDDSHIWTIDAENDFRPSKRQRTALTERCLEKYGIDCDSIAGWKTYSLTTDSFSEEDMEDASSSLESSSDTMENCEDINHESVESILQYYIRANSDMDFLKKGLDKLLELIGAKNKNHEVATKQCYRSEMLHAGGHWMVANLLTTLTQEHGHEPNTAMETMNDEDFGSAHIHDTNDEMVIAVVVRSCQILRELLLTNPNLSKTPIGGGRIIDNVDTVVRYQVYCAGGLDAVVSALKRFPTSFEVQLAGCQCLSQLVSFKGGHANINHDSAQRRNSTNPTTTTLVKNLYQSTDRLNIVVRLIGGGSRNSMSNGSNKLFLSSTQMWQLFFVVADIVRSVVRQSTLDSNCRSEVIRTVEKCLVCDGGPSNDDTMVIDEQLHGNGCENGFNDPSGKSRGYYYRPSRNTTRPSSGIGKYMYEHLMTILTDEEDCYEADVSSTYMNE